MKIADDVQHLRLLESVIAHTKDAIMITEAEPQNHPGPRILYVNEAFISMTGYLAEDVIGKTPRILQGPKTSKTELKKLSKAMAKWQNCEITVINYKKNGDEFLINFSISPLADENGIFTHWISIKRDVTESKKLEQEFNQIFNQAPDIICTVGLDGYFKKVNPAMCSLLGYTEQEILTTPLVKFIHRDEQVKVMNNLEVMNKGNIPYNFENRCVTKSGSIIWLSWTSSPTSEDGLIFTVAKNITDKKELEDLLHKATNLAGIGGWEIDLDKGTLYWSDIAKEIFEVATNYIPTLTSAVDFCKNLSGKKFIKEQIENAIAICIPFDVELEIVTSKGNSRWIRIIGEPEFEGGRCTRIRGSFQDISTIKNAEIQVKETLAEKNTILESIDDAFFAVDKNWIINYWNNSAEKVLIKKKAETLNKNLWDVFADSIDSKSYKNYHFAIKNNETVHFEDYYPPLSKWYEISAYPSINGLSVYFKDITERKQIQEKLVNSEKRYSELFQLSPLPKWVFDKETLFFLDVNNAALKNYGYTTKEFLSMTIKDIRPFEELSKLNKILKNSSLKEEFSQQGIFTHRKKNGELIKVEILSNNIQYNGRDAKIVIANDITERLSYVKAIEKQNEKFKEVSWMQSHLIRAPLARIMSLVGLTQILDERDKERVKVLEYLLTSANELDVIIKDITEKTKI